MILFEMLHTPESKKKFREMVLKYHPDTGHYDDFMIKKINNAKDTGDSAIDTLYRELFRPEEAKKDKHHEKEVERLKKFYQKQRASREEERKKQKEKYNEGPKNIKEKVSQIKQWLLESDFANYVNKHYIAYKVEENLPKDEIVFTIIINNPRLRRLEEKYHLSSTITKDEVFELIRNVNEHWTRRL